jgi:hypothetical protein
MNVLTPTLVVFASALAIAPGSHVASARTGASTDTATQVTERQPNMEAALAQLREARASLERAEHDKGGWRAKAIDATSAAIRETERGIAFDNKH